MTDTGLGRTERDWLAAVRDASSLADLASVVGAADGHEAYLTAKPRWETLRGRELAVDGRERCDDDRGVAGHGRRGTTDTHTGMAGSCTRVDGRAFHVHGITHADTAAERSAVRAAARDVLADGGAVYCEQGIRRLYLSDTDACAMDDYRWATARCREVGLGDDLDDLLDDPGDDASPAGGTADWDATPGHADQFEAPESSVIDRLQRRFRDAALDLLESDAGVDGVARRALRDVASAFPPSHEELATGRDAEAVRRRRAAAADPAQLDALQRYYERAFLPQALEREWLARHDPELEIVTHARNARMADYAVAHATSDPVHLFVGAAHGPGVREYLEHHRDGRRTLEGFDLV